MGIITLPKTELLPNIMGAGISKRCGCRLNHPKIREVTQNSRRTGIIVAKASTIAIMLAFSTSGYGLCLRADCRPIKSDLGVAYNSQVCGGPKLVPALAGSHQRRGQQPLLAQYSRVVCTVPLRFELARAGGWERAVEPAHTVPVLYCTVRSWIAVDAFGPPTASLRILYQPA